MNKKILPKKAVVILYVMIIAIICGIATGIFLALTHDLPQIRSLETFRPPSVTRIYSADKALLAELFIEKRDPVSLCIIPDYLKAAIVATEDRNFYRHSGVDLKGILRAIIKDIRKRKFVEGASTITQQLAKTLFLTSRKTLTRKFKEAVIALQLERRYTKNEILELYLNQVYFGSGAYGVESAAKIFFGKSAKDLSLGQCALIAGMPKAPSRYSPLVNMDLAILRRNTVLKQMQTTGIITKTVCDKTMRELVVLNKPGKNFAGAPYFVEYIKKNMENVLGSSLLYKGGLTIFTTLSRKMQEAAKQAAANGLLALEERMKQQKIINPDPQCAIVALDVQSGGILAMTGGKNYFKSPFNRASAARRQPGSAFKPVVYACAVERGFPQNMILLDAPVVFKGGRNGKDWMPENFSGKYMGELTLRRALALSKNIPAVRLVEMLGPFSVSKFGRSLGIKSPLLPNLSLALGTSETTLLELTSAYAVFPNRGKSIKPFGVTEVLDHTGRTIWRVKPRTKAAMSRAGAAIMVNMLKAVVNKGTGRKARVIGRPVAGKTGTTDKYRDALFVGFSPSITTGVWVGRDAFVSLGKGETGARAALPIWIEFMAKALAGKPCRHFDFPDDVVRVSIDPLSGLHVPDNSPGAVSALFKKGTEPK